MPTSTGAVTRQQSIDVPGTSNFQGDSTFQSNATFNAVVTLAQDPTSDLEAVPKQYVDAAIQGLDHKDEALVATTTNEADIDIDEAPLTVDGVTLSAGDRVLVKDNAYSSGAGETSTDASATRNGLYKVDTLLDTDSDGTDDACTLVRTADADEDSEVDSGLYVFVEDGSLNAGTGFIISTADPITVGSTAIEFTKFTDTTVNAGDGLSKSGSTVSLVAPGSPANLTLAENGNDIDITFDLPSDRSNVKSYEILKNDSDSFELVKIVDDADITNDPVTITDTEVRANVSTTYRVYAVLENGVRSISVSNSITPANTVADPTNISAKNPPNSTYFDVKYSIPDETKLEEVIIKVDAKADSANLSEADATEIYRGLSDNVFYEIVSGEEDYAHEFYATSVTSTS